MTELSQLAVQVCCLVFAVLDRFMSDGWQKVPDALSEVPQFHWKVGLAACARVCSELVLLTHRTLVCS